MFTRSRHAPSAVAVAVALLVTAGCASGGGRDDRVVPAPGPTSLTTGASPTTPAAQATRVGAVVPEDPVRLVLPSGTPVPVTSVRTTANGVLDVPSDVEAAGWWPGGSRIGDPFGSTLIAAHVDSTAQGVGPFASLLSVARGDRVVLRSVGLEQVFRVRSLRLRPQGSIEPDSELYSPAGDRRLTLVTCAGPYDASRGGYQNLAVVVAVPSGPPRPRPGS